MAKRQGREIRPPLALRVGVTGSRRIPDEMDGPLRLRVGEVLRLIRDQAIALAADPEARPVYAAEHEDGEATFVRMISPLAAGADRLLAEEAVKLGYRLHAPLPFSRSDYEKDFEGDVAAFRALAARAEILELDGGRGADETASYEAVGRFVVRNSDLLIAIWDGKPARGRGGSAEIVYFAARSGVPVWWIDLTDGAAKFIRDPLELERPGAPPEGEEAQAALAAYLARIAVPLSAPSPVRRGLIGRAAQVAAKQCGEPNSPLVAYLEERPGPTRGIWRARRYLLALLAPDRGPRESVRMVSAATLVECWWEANYARADAASKFHGDRYRSSYVLIIGLAFAAFAASFAFESGARSALAVWLDLILLLCAGGLVLQNHRQGWHERWIAYRLLAELCRTQLALAPLGRALPGLAIRRSALDAVAEHDGERAPREAWVSWYFLALQRAAPMPEGAAVSAKSRAFALARSLVSEQEQYHRVRGVRTEKADRRLVASGEAFFFLALLTVVAQIALLWAGAGFDAARPVELALRLFSAAAAALVGLRAYAEFGLLARQSQRMRATMKEMAAELDAIDLDEPLASQKLGATIQRLAIVMLQDVRGWAQIFRLKSVETS